MRNATVDAAVSLEIDGRSVRLGAYATSRRTGARVRILCGGRVAWQRRADLGPDAPLVQTLTLPRRAARRGRPRRDPRCRRPPPRSRTHRKPPSRPRFPIPRRPSPRRRPWPATTPCGSPPSISSSTATRRGVPRTISRRPSVATPAICGPTPPSAASPTNAAASRRRSAGFARRSPPPPATIRIRPAATSTTCSGLTRRALGDADEAVDLLRQGGVGRALAGRRAPCARRDRRRARRPVRRPWRRPDLAIARNARHAAARHLQAMILAPRRPTARRDPGRRLDARHRSAGRRRPQRAHPARARRRRCRPQRPGRAPNGWRSRGARPARCSTWPPATPAAGAYDDAIELLERTAAVPDPRGRRAPGHEGAAGMPNLRPLLHYAAGHYAARAGRSALAARHRARAASSSRDACFPNTLEHQAVLESALAANPDDAGAAYMLGLFWYDRRDVGAGARVLDAGTPARPDRRADPPGARDPLVQQATGSRRGPAVDAARFGAGARRCPDALRARPAGEAPRRRRGRAPATAHAPSRARRGARRSLGRVRHAPQRRRPSPAGPRPPALAPLPPVGGRRRQGAGAAPDRARTAGAACARPRDVPTRRSRCSNGPASIPSRSAKGGCTARSTTRRDYWLGRAHASAGRTTRASRVLARGGRRARRAGAGALLQRPGSGDHRLPGASRSPRSAGARPPGAASTTLVRFGTDHLRDRVEIDFFAVSVPEFQVFDDDLEIRHEVNCRFLRALGWWGLGARARARAELARVLALDPAHQAARLTLRWGP